VCVIFIAFKRHPRFRLIAAANRDEFHERPTLAAHWWSPGDPPGRARAAHSTDILAGRDQAAGGTWMGVSRSGRFAAVTNFREPGEGSATAPQSRGSLVTGFLGSDAHPLAYAQAIDLTAYTGFSLFLADRDHLAYVSNRGEAGPQELPPGVYGLSNGTLDSSWPKVTEGKERFATILNANGRMVEQLFRLLGDRTRAVDALLPDTGVGVERERELSSLFIVNPLHGTRSSTVIRIAGDGAVDFEERRFDAAGRAAGSSSETFALR
jgi:uncharacterized protein with NRDE domain